MSTMAYQITSLAIVYSTVYSGADQRKHQGCASLVLCGNSPVTGEFPAQRDNNAEIFSIWWLRHAGTTPHRIYDDTIKRNHHPRHWPFVRGIHRLPMDSPHKGQWRGSLIFPLMCAWTNGWAKNWDAGDLTRHRAHYGVTLILIMVWIAIGEFIFQQ